VEEASEEDQDSCRAVEPILVVVVVMMMIMVVVVVVGKPQTWTGHRG
jgi:hypothetical protein